MMNILQSCRGRLEHIEEPRQARGPKGYYYYTLSGMTFRSSFYITQLVKEKTQRVRSLFTHNILTRPSLTDGGLPSRGIITREITTLIVLKREIFFLEGDTCQFAI
jgi:hypothetical protein